MKLGYARVSTSEQNMALQVDALRAAGAERIFGGSWRQRIDCHQAHLWRDAAPGARR